MRVKSCAFFEGGAAFAMDLSTIIGSAALTAIDVNGLFVRANSIGRHLEPYCDPALFCSREINDYNPTKSGSSVRAKIFDRYFCICTHHQLSKHRYEFDQFCLSNSEAKKLTTSECAFFFHDNVEQDYDFLMFEFTAPVRKGLLPRHHWYDITKDLERSLTPKPCLVLSIGFPGHLNSIDYDQMSYSSQAYAVYGSEANSSIKGRLAFKPDPEVSFDPAGMSGGPVFGISINGTTLKLFLAGIVSNATRSKFNFVPLSHLSRAIIESLT